MECLSIRGAKQNDHKCNEYQEASFMAVENYLDNFSFCQSYINNIYLPSQIAIFYVVIQLER